MEEKRQPQPDKKENTFVISPEIERHMQILRKDPKSPVFAILSEAYRKGGLLDEAIATAVEGLKHNPNYTSGRVALGRAYFDKGEMDKAIEELKKVIKSTPDNIISHKLIADIYVKKSDRPSALQELKTILYLSPDDKEAKKLIDTLSKPLPAEEKQQAPEPSVPAQPVQAPQEPPAVEQQVQKPFQTVPERPEPERPEPERPEIKKPSEPEVLIPEQHHEEKVHESAAAAPVVMPEPKEEPEENIVRHSQAGPTPGEAPVAAADVNTSSIENELESEMNKPLTEFKTDETPATPEQEVMGPAEGRTGSPEDSAPPEEKAPSGPPVQEQPGFTEITEDTKDEVKEEELEAVFDDLAQSAEIPSVQQSTPSPAQKREEAPGPAWTQEIRTENPAGTEYAPPVADEPEQAPEAHGQVPSETPKPGELHGDDIQTVTMADLYIKQGHLDKAYHIYRTILLKTPDSPVIRAKLVKVKNLSRRSSRTTLTNRSWRR
jgi:tetratricopeptide (TPR) repeat protein